MKWNKNQHEAGVERFYGTGAEKFGEYHGGYLNFGLWEKGVDSYIAAAENLICHIGRMIGLNNKSRLLDVGCGFGAQDVLMRKTFHCVIDALDVTLKHVKATQKRSEKAGFEKYIRAHHGSATQLPFKNKTFTHITSIEGTIHFNTREDFFREAYRVLQKGGKIGIADYIMNRPPRTLLERMLIKLALKLWHVPKENLYGIDGYKKKMMNNGFKRIVIKQMGALTIPSYYHEQHRLKTRRELARIRGWFAAYPGHIIDYVVYELYRRGMLEYLIIRAEK